MNLAEYAEAFYRFSLIAGQGLLGIAFFLVVFRIMKGPTLPDRVLALDMLTSVAIAFIAIIGIDTGYTLYVDIAIALGLVGFLATVAFARFVLARGQTEDEGYRELPFTDPHASDDRQTLERSRS